MIENYILSALVQDEEFSRKALPFLKKDYFADDVFCITGIFF